MEIYQRFLSGYIYSSIHSSIQLFVHSCLFSQEVELKAKNEQADALIQIVGQETEKVSKEKEIADQVRLDENGR